MNDTSRNFSEQGEAFQKIWLESMSKLMQAAFTFSPDSTPPDVLREIRNGVLHALGESWNQFLRSPQFQENMKQWMENAVAFRQTTNDFMARVREDMQAPSRDDIEAILQNMRHLETRILDRLETLAKQMEELKGHAGAARTATRKPSERSVPNPSKRQRAKKSRSP